MKRRIDDDLICVCCGREILSGHQYCIICGYELNKPKSNNDFCGTMCKFTEDIINRQKAEIERLEHQLKTLCLTLKLAKAEAYKEFTGKLHEELRIYGIKDKFNKLVFLNVVDKAKKELVGEEK